MKESERLTEIATKQLKMNRGTNYAMKSNTSDRTYYHEDAIDKLGAYENTSLSPAEIEALKAENEKNKTTLFLTVRSRIMEEQFEKGINTNDVGKIAVRTIQKMEEMIDYPNATKTRLISEKELEEAK